MVRVIDASVGIKWFLKEEGRDLALRILEAVLKAPGDFAVPELFFFEIAHVLHRVAGKLLPMQEELFALLLTVGLNRFSMTKELRAETEGFQSLGLSGYDGAYVALAKLLKGRWITLDKRAHRRIAHLDLSEVPV